jgi:hypothetical protein
VRGSRVLVLGLTFKENCPDIRNTKVVDMVRSSQDLGARVDVHDPWVDPAEARHEYGIDPVAAPERAAYDAVVLAVAHREFRPWAPRASAPSWPTRASSTTSSTSCPPTRSTGVSKAKRHSRAEAQRGRGAEFLKMVFCYSTLRVSAPLRLCAKMPFSKGS